MMIDSAREFLARCFSPEETIALLLRRESPPALVQRIVLLEQALAPKYLRWLAHQNANGMNIYVAANPLRRGSRNRTKESIAAIRHLYLDIDVDGESRLAALRTSTTVPQPNAVVATSAGKYQVLWRVQGFHFATQEQTLKQLAAAFGGDPACTDCNRVIRLPGFHNRKYTPSQLVTVEYLSELTSHPEGFCLGDTEPHLLARRMERPTFSRTNGRTQSERDWAWVLAELSRGRNVVELTEALASRRPDKPNPRYYAQRTVEKASARLSARMIPDRKSA